MITQQPNVNNENREQYINDHLRATRLDETLQRMLNGKFTLLREKLRQMSFYALFKKNLRVMHLDWSMEMLFSFTLKSFSSLCLWIDFDQIWLRFAASASQRHQKIANKNLLLMRSSLAASASVSFCSSRITDWLRAETSSSCNRGVVSDFHCFSDLRFYKIF